MTAHSIQDLCIILCSVAKFISEKFCHFFFFLVTKLLDGQGLLIIDLAVTLRYTAFGRTFLDG